MPAERPLAGLPRPVFLDALATELAAAAATLAPTVAVTATRVGVLADTHCSAADGSDLPGAVIDALAGCDLVLHCGDLSTAAVLERLTTVAPVLAVRSAIDPPADGIRLREGPLLVRAGSTLIGMIADLPGPSDPSAVFGTDVDVVVSGTTHVPRVARVGSTVLVNPGSPTLPATTGPTLALLDLAGPQTAVHLVHLVERPGREP